MPLFNGNDLSGWRNINCAPGTWSVKDGAIHSTGAPICELRTERMYENFVLDVEWMHLTPKGNAGVFIWADPLPARGQPFLRAIEVQVLDGRETPRLHVPRRHLPDPRREDDAGSPASRGWERSLPTREAREAGRAVEPLSDHARDRGRITLEVNGKAVSGGYDITPRKGYIALESEGAPAMFRNLRIRELPSADALPADHVAAVDQGYRSLYSGVDLSGWTEGEPVGHFAPADWQIAAGGAGRAPKGTLISVASFQNLDFFIDWRCGAPGRTRSPRRKK